MKKIKTLKPIECPNFVDAMKRAVRGYEFLNKNEPGWQKKIRPEMLHLDDSYTCVIGQVYGDFSHLLAPEPEGYGFDQTQAAWLGFERRGTIPNQFDDFTDPYARGEQDYSMLQEAWLMLIKNDGSWQSMDADINRLEDEF